MSEKTCGNCTVWSHVANDIGVCSVGGTTIGEDDYFEIRNEFDDCRHSDSFEPFEYSLQQRYKQLEQVARNMLADIDAMVCFIPYLNAEKVNGYRKQLRECGVSLDD